MNDVIKEEKIENMIYEIRGRQVMLDSDLARLYECKNGTKEVNQAVKNNIDKFPMRYSFQLLMINLQKFVVPSWDHKNKVATIMCYDVIMFDSYKKIFRKK